MNATAMLISLALARLVVTSCIALFLHWTQHPPKKANERRLYTSKNQKIFEVCKEKVALWCIIHKKSPTAAI